MRGLWIIFDPLQIAEVSPFFGKKGTVCLTVAVALASRVWRELKDSMWLSCLILTTLKEGEQE